MCATVLPVSSEPGPKWGRTFRSDISRVFAFTALASEEPRQSEILTHFDILLSFDIIWRHETEESTKRSEYLAFP
jgi:hypothetical protein